MAILVVRLVPKPPVGAVEFTGYLEGLTITAFEVSLDNLDGTEIGQASFSPEVGLPAIVQHRELEEILGIETPQPKSVATAMIEIESDSEFATPDIRFEIVRNGHVIVSPRIYYNVPVADGGIVHNPFEVASLGPSLHLALPAPPNVEIEGSEVRVDLPQDGTPPRFSQLREAVEAVLAVEPGDVDTLPNLTPRQCRYVAAQIVWNRSDNPLPDRSLGTLHDLYTGERDSSSDIETDRRRFEGEQLGYYASLEAETERLAGYVFALSTAVFAEGESVRANEARLRFPVHRDPADIDSPSRTAEVELRAAGAALDPAFGVPAAYFYVLAAPLALQASREERYRLAVGAGELQLEDAFAQAMDDRVIDDPPPFFDPANGTSINGDQAIRRLGALGSAEGPGPACVLEDGIRTLVGNWLNFEGPDIDAFWNPVITGNQEGYLDLVLCALTRGDDDLTMAIRNRPVASAAELAAITADGWRAFFLLNPALPPEFTRPGSPAERVEAFIQHVRLFFDILPDDPTEETPSVAAPLLFERSPSDPLVRFIGEYESATGQIFRFGETRDENDVSTASQAAFPDDLPARAWLEQLILTLDELRILAEIDLPQSPQATRDGFILSLMEALCVRGFTSREEVRALSLEDFRAALTGTVAFDHAQAIYANAEPAEPEEPGDDAGRFLPVNDGCVVNCVPSACISPFSPTAYLHELLRLKPTSTCDDPFPDDNATTIGERLAARRGPLGELNATCANLETSLPLIDLVNECLEAVAGSIPDSFAGVIYQTASEELAGHALCPPPPPAGKVKEPDNACHDPETLFEALPEHSTPATPVAEPVGWEALAVDFSDCILPYSQPLDINRTYLSALRTSRFETMRTFRRDITEFVLDPENPPDDFESHRRREPVTEAIAAEYLGVNPEVLRILFRQDIPDADLPAFFGFPSDQIDGQSWLEIVVQLDEFLERTCLTYCQFFELWQAEFVGFRRRVLTPSMDDSFPDCQPCDLDDYSIELIDPNDPEDALRQLIVFIRLWRILQAVPGARYTFAELRDICEVLGLFNEDETINPDFIRWLSAFQRTRDRLRLPLADTGEPSPANAVGADRTHILALTSPPHQRFAWALDQVLDKLQPYAEAKYRCPRRPPHFLKLLAENRDALSRLAGFDPAVAGDEWNGDWPDIVRMVEVWAKLYASNFTVGQILCLFTADEHLHGDDPFPLQPPNEALCRPFGFADDTPKFSLWALRGKLLAVEVSDEDAAAYTWTRIDAVLRDEFGYAAPLGQTDRLISVGQHFFPDVLEAEGIVVDVTERQYRTPLANTSPPMWNTPTAGPFLYDEIAAELVFDVPTTNEAFIEKLSLLRPLPPAAQNAVRTLYRAPREDLCALSFLFPNFIQADRALIQEPDAERRWTWFQKAFAVFHARCKIIAAHFAEHVAAVTGRPNTQGIDLAWQVLRHLRADENFALAPGEVDDGAAPPVFWGPQPHGGAFAALLGLAGTGLLGTYRREDGTVIWEEMRALEDVFGDAENAWNAPIPTVIPSMDLVLTEDQERFLGIRNGFGMDARTGKVIGGLEGYRYDLRGLLLVEKEGEYEFRFGGPTPEGEPPDTEAVKRFRWFVRLQQGQATWSLLVKDWLNEEGPEYCSAPVRLRPGVYEMVIQFHQPRLTLDGPEDVCPQTTGYRLKYAGPDTEGRLITPPHKRLFLDVKTYPLTLSAGPQQPGLSNCYTSSVRDMRRTALRVFMALLCAHNHDMSAQEVTDSGLSEFDFFPVHPQEFPGVSYGRSEPNFITHRAHYNFNLLPVLDNYHPPLPDQDQRAQPSLVRRQALFDVFFESLFDYTRVREASASALVAPTVRFLHEISEAHIDIIAQALRHLGIDLRHANLVFRYFAGVELTNTELLSFHWLVRIWNAELWIRSLLKYFLPADIRELRPDLCASDEPGNILPAETESGNANLTRFYRAGCIENGDPRRYSEIKPLNDGLRLRGRAALLAYLTGMNRVPSLIGGFVEQPKQLSERLLIDVEAGICQKASRIEEAISAVQIYVLRALLGLEPGLPVSEAFSLFWERRFATYHEWERCKGRELYRENWIEWDEFAQARRTEAFRFLEEELRRSTVTAAVPGGLEHWPDRRPPQHPGLILAQEREPALLNRLEPSREGFDLLATRDRHARRSWLAALREEVQTPPTDPSGVIPFWIESAIRQGAEFQRVAAAGPPPAALPFAARDRRPDTGCCADCGATHPLEIGELYVWLEAARHFLPREQDADRGVTEITGSAWHDPQQLPSLLHWPSVPVLRLVWSWIHNGEVQPPRRSAAGVLIDPDAAGGGANVPPQPEFLGRIGDSLFFRVAGGLIPDGVPAPPDPEDPPPPEVWPGFRLDLAEDRAYRLPMIAEPEPFPAFPGGLAGYPFFAYFPPGAPLFPLSLFSPAFVVADALRSHFRFEAALKWYELVLNPLRVDLSELWCLEGQEPVIPGAVPILPATEISDELARNRAVVLRYVATLLERGNAVMHRNSPEAFHQAGRIFDTAARILGPVPPTVFEDAEAEAPMTVGNFVPPDPPLNPCLLRLYHLTADRLALIHACLNDRRLRIGGPKQHPYWGNSLIPEGGCETPNDICADADDWCLCPGAPYRFEFLVRRAIELAESTRSFGAALLAAYEKGDGEYLQDLRQTHEEQLARLRLGIMQDQWRAQEWDTQGVIINKERTHAQLVYTQLLMEDGLISEENQYRSLTQASIGLTKASQAPGTVAQIFHLIPDPYIGQNNFSKLPVGDKLGFFFEMIAEVLRTSASASGSTGGLRLTEGGWVRRADEWEQRASELRIELDQIERQINAAERRRDAALQEVNNHQTLIENSADISNFLRDKFTGQDLFLWLQKETAALHEQMCGIAYHTARLAQRAFNFERCETTRTFLPTQSWDTLHEKLLAGDRLLQALREMEQAYLCENVRQYELTMPISLRMHFPLAFLRLLATGSCEIELTEWMFDKLYPGHYCRRIKNVSLTIPCVVGPYTTVQCRLTLLKSMTRVAPYLVDPSTVCCRYEQPKNGYAALPDDPRVVNRYAATEAIATSTGQNDTGMFELNFRDERYLPFEYAGAVSTWRIEIPPENNFWDTQTITDVIIHLRYMAREGGELLRKAAHECAEHNLPGGGLRMFDIRHDFPNEWHRFTAASADSTQPRELCLKMARSMFPFLPGNKEVRITQLLLFIEAPGADPSAHRNVEFLASKDGLTKAEYRKCDVDTIFCVASAGWPRMFHGVLDMDLVPLSRNGVSNIGSLWFGPDIGILDRLFLFCRYSVAEGTGTLVLDMQQYSDSFM